MRRWLAAVAGASMLACSTVPPRIGAEPPEVQNEHEEKAYQALLARYSTHQELYQGFDTQLFSAATYLAWPMREGILNRQAEFLHWTPDLLAQHAAEEKTRAAQYLEFFFGAQTTEPRFNDFDAKKSIWRVVLETSKGQVLPAKIEQVGRADINMRAYFPYMSDFWVGYRVLFPRVLENGQPTIPEGDAAVKMVIASTLGTVEFRAPVD